MPAISRKGDSVMSPDGAHNKCRSPLQTSVDETNTVEVYANGILIVASGDKVAPHPKGGCSPDESILSSNSITVFIANDGVGRIGDKYGNNIIIKGSSNVFSD
jgi:hypothetical protein